MSRTSTTGSKGAPRSGSDPGGAMPTSAPRRGLSTEAWIAVGTIAAALITGVVTVLTHVLPQGSSSPSSQPQVAAPAAATTSIAPASTPPSPIATTTAAAAASADAIAGAWSGMAKDAQGMSFRITLDIKRPCVLNERCGSISVSHVPCHGDVFLEAADRSKFEFRVANFRAPSNPAVCQPGAGEHFELQPDGTLLYTTTYEPAARGVLERTKE